MKRAIRHYLEKDEDLRENPSDQARLDASIQAAFVLARAAVSAARDIRDMVLRLPPYLEGRPSALHRHYDAVWSFLAALWELIDFCELEQEVASSDVEDPIWFFGRAIDQHLGGNPFEAMAILDEAGLSEDAADPWIQMLRAEAHAASGDQVEAIRAWEAACAMDPLMIQAHVSVAGELEALGRDREAYGHWLAVRDKLPADDPVAAEAKRHLARLRQRAATKPADDEPEPFPRLPRWGPSWVPAWPGLGRQFEGASPAAAAAASGGAWAAGEPGPTGVSGEPGTPNSGSQPQPPQGILSRFGLRGPARTGRLQVLLGLTGAKDTDLTVYVAGPDPTCDGVQLSRSAAYLGGARLVGPGTADPEAAESEEPDLIVMASGISPEQCHALAEKTRSGLLRGRAGPTSFIYNGPADRASDLAVIFEGLPLEVLPDICPPGPDPDLSWQEPAPEGDSPDEALDPAAFTMAAVERRVRERLEGKPAPRSITARGAIGLVPVLGWLDGGEGRHGGKIPPLDLIAVSAEPQSLETVAIGAERTTGHSFGPGGVDRGRLVEELFEEMPRVLPPGDTALLMSRLLGEGGPVTLADGPEAFLAASLAGGVLARAMEGLRQTMAAQSYYVTRSNHLLVGGSLISRLPSPEYALLAAIDGCQPTGVTRVLLDPYGILAALGDGLVGGRLKPGDPSLADGAASLLAGSCMAVAPLVQGVNWGRPGRKPVLEATVKGAWRDGERTWQLYRGEVIWVSLPAGRRVELAVRPAPTYNVGRGRGAEWHGEFVAGGLGLILDGRGRPLRLPADEASRTTLRAVWASEILGKAKGA